MKSRTAGIWLGVASALLAISLALWDTQSASPGPISAVHEKSASIDGDDCAVCHGGSPDEMRAACAECHADVEAQVAAGTGFHGKLPNVARCGTCHAEHHGVDFELVSAGAFALAGVADRDAFAHEGLGFALSGVHTSLACRACHANADVVLLEKDAQRFTGKSQDCAGCHQDPHAGKLPDCRSCHGETEPFAVVAEFEHPSSFALVGVHAQASCVACHAPGTAFAIEAGGGETATRTPRSCEACHASPHASPFISAIVARIAVERGATCASCHPVAGGPFASPRTLTVAEHALTGFPLVAPHAAAACTDCHATLRAPDAHAEAFADFRASHPGRTPDDCASCHADPHGGQFQTGAFAQGGCLACHERERFDPPAFGFAQHARTAFALTGAHSKTACRACHAQIGDAPRVFHGTNATCSACHADAHTGFFAQKAASLAATASAATNARADDCATCHTTTDFQHVAAETFDHARWTGFALVGAHAESECAACHAARAAPDERGRSFGVVAESYPGSPEDCATCHVDAHGGFFARRPDAPTCTACHDPHGFEQARDAFDHTRSTGFALDGAHARADCATCHPSGSEIVQVSGAVATAAGVERALRSTVHAGEGSFQNCATCHTDVHAGAFDGPRRPGDVGGRTGCARCHTTESFTEVAASAFDHAAWTGFALTGVHADAGCASCHPRSGGAASNTAFGARGFARAAGTNCSDCHADPHAGQFSRNGSTDCATCHATAPDFLALRFDHQHDARFALDTTHAQLACSACHVPWALPGGGSAVRYKPLGVECGDCHVARRGGF